MKDATVYTALLLILIAQMAIPVSIVYGVCQWGAFGIAPELAAWGAAKVLLFMVILGIPGLLFGYFTE